MTEKGQRQIDYLNINHHFMTIHEMALELKVSDAYISQLCRDHNFTPITQNKRIEEYIQANQHLTQEDVSEHFGIHVTNMYSYMKNVGIKLKTRGQVERENATLKAESDSVKKIIPIETWPQEQLEYINELTGYNPASKTPIKRVREPFTQTGSQFTDELRGITTTKRVDVSARDAKIE